jgi:multiple sugar transport system permease protein
VDAEAGGTPERHCGRLIPIPALAIIGLLIVFPLAFNLYMSLQTWFVSSATSPQFVGVRNFIEILGMDVRFWNSIWITVKFAAIGVWLDLILGLGIALYVQRDFPGKGTFRTVMLLPMVSTPVACGADLGHHVQPQPMSPRLLSDWSWLQGAPPALALSLW